MGRSAKTNNNSNQGTTIMASSSEEKKSSNKISKKVSDEPEEQVETGFEEVWDLVRVVRKQDSLDCRMEDCKNKAVAVWACSLDLADEWPMCEGCQCDDFGGWPEGIAPPEEEEQDETKAGLKAPPATQGDDESSVQARHVATKGSKTLATTNDEANNLDASQHPVSSSDEGSATGKASCTPHKEHDILDFEASPADQITKAKAKTSKPSAVAVPPVTQDDKAGADSPPDSVEEDEEDESWDLKKILSLEALTALGTLKCSTESCTLAACSVWISSTKPPTKWYSCIDCQEADFDGWPPLEELPVKHLEAAHVSALVSKCSKQKNPTMPVFPSITALSPCPGKTKSNATTSHCVTPLPPNSCAGTAIVTESQVTPKAKQGGVKVTPNPSGAKNGGKQPSAGALAMHKKWQAAAEAAGGKDARIVVSKPQAKKIIFDLLFDAFRPMNITEIHKSLKAVIPSPVLNACLQDMALDKQDDENQFADSDDEDDEEPAKKKKKKSEPLSTEPYSGSLLLKPGRNTSSHLYFIDHNKIKGMDRDQREELATSIANSKAEEEALQETLKSTSAATVKLLSEPTNEEATLFLTNRESEIKELEAKLGESKKFTVNEQHKVKTKRRIANMAISWRKRKRLCISFLSEMENATDGTVSARKCLNGDGQITLDSDEAVSKAAVQFAKDKKARAGGLPNKRARGLTQGKKSADKNSNSLANSDFVAVVLGNQGVISRVYVDQEE